MIRRSYTQGGFTLLEVTVSSLLLAIVMCMAFSISMDCTKSAQEKISMMDLEVKGERTLKALTSSLSECATLSISSNGATITYSVPLDTDNNGIVLSKNLSSLEWGASTEVGKQNNGTITFQFIPVKRFDESAINIDLNGDGDRNDMFDVGYIQRSSTVTGDLPMVMGVTNFVQRTGAYGTSLLRDGGTDLSGKLFSMASGSRVIELNLCLMDYTPSGIPHRVVSKGQVFLRNQVAP